MNIALQMLDDAYQGACDRSAEIHLASIDFRCALEDVYEDLADIIQT